VSVLFIFLLSAIAFVPVFHCDPAKSALIGQSAHISQTSARVAGPYKCLYGVILG